MRNLYIAATAATASVSTTPATLAAVVSALVGGAVVLTGATVVPLELLTALLGTAETVDSGPIGVVRTGAVV